MSVILSRTSQPPYAIIDTINVDEQTLVVTGKGGRDILTSRSTLYLVIEDEVWDTVEIRVENENLTGVSLFITTTDILGNPENWVKKIVLNDVDASSTTFIIGLMTEWRLINNIYFIIASEVNVQLNVYGS